MHAKPSEAGGAAGGSPAQIAKATKDFFLISLQLAGNGSVLQDSRCAHLKPGQLALYDTTRSYALLFTQAFRQMVLQMPRERLRPLLALPQASVVQAVDGRRGLGKVAVKVYPSGLSIHMRTFPGSRGHVGMRTG